MRALRRRVTTILAALLVMTPVVAYGQTLSAVWDPNPPADQVTGYQVCIGTSSLTCNFQQATVPSTETDYTFTPVAGTLYRVAVKALSASGSGSYSPEVLVSIPSLTQPSNRTSTVNSPITTVTLSAVDPDGGTLQFAHTGLPFGLSLNTSSGVISGTPTSAGTFNVTVFVNDGLATVSRTFVWTVDPAGETNPPTLSITSHTTGQTVTASSITLSGTATDSGSGGSGITSVTVNGSAATGGTASASNTANWSRSVSLVAGANVLSVVATDGAGNATTSQITVTRNVPDTTAPTLSITSHTTGQTVSATSITLSGTATDSGAGGSGITSVTVNGSAATGGTASASSTASWSQSVTLAVGANVLTVVATDGASNARTSTITVTRSAPDTTDPIIAITSHSSGQTVGTTTITLSGTATDSGAGGSGITSVTVNGANATGGTATGSNTANWSRSVTLSAGANVLTVVATDGAGNDRTTPITVSLDTADPVLAITSHTSGQTVSSASITLSGTATDSGNGGSGIASVTVNGSNATGGTATGSNTASWSRAITLSVGANTITVETRDGANNLTTSQISLTYAVSPVTSVALSSNIASPQQIGTTVTFTAAGSGGVAPRQYKFLVQLGSGSPQLAQNWSTTATYAMTTPTVGSYTVTVWARSAGVTADAAQASDQESYTFTAPVPLSISSLTSNVASPQIPGTSINFSTAATGGTAPYQFKWWVFDGAAWTVVKNWSTSTSLTWQPSTPGTYTVAVWGRNAGVTADASQALSQVTYVINSSLNPLSINSLTSNVASPQTAGTSINFTAAASGGTSPYQFKWWVSNGTTWTVVKDWSTSASLAWQPTAAGTYTVAVWARNAGVTTDASQAMSQATYVISAAASPLSITSLTSNVASPQLANTSINFATTATGGTAPYQFKFLVFDGSAWSIARDWSTSAAMTWQPSTPGSYTVVVWGRNAGVTADASQALAQVSYVISAPASAPLSINSLTSNLASPQTTGTSINFTASASGGTAPYQFKFWVFNGTSWAIARDWSTSASMAWQAPAAGSYTVAVWARNAGVTTDASQALAQVSYVVTAPGSSSPLSITSFTSNLASPEAAGTPITITASATGGLAPYQFKFWVFNGSVWAIARDWSTSASMTWQPTIAGTYTVAVWGRNAGVGTDASQAMSQMSYVISPAGSSSPLSITGMTSNVASPRSVGSTITFTTTATGGLAPYQFKYWVFDGSEWTMARDWSTSPSLTWQPSTAGSYTVAVWGRNAGATTDASEAMSQLSYVITGPGNPLSITGLTSNLSSPRMPGTAIQFTAAATGGASPYQFKFWVFDGTSWTMARDWSTSPTLNWQPTVAGSYTVAVWGRNAGVTADASQSLAQMPYLISSTLTITSLTSNRVSPQPANTSIVFTTAATGGNGPYQFKWWVFDGTSWSVAKEWSTGTTMTWRPSASGSYIVAVWGRDGGVTADASQSLAQVAYVIP